MSGLEHRRLGPRRRMPPLRDRHAEAFLFGLIAGISVTIVSFGLVAFYLGVGICLRF